MQAASNKQHRVRYHREKRQADS